MEKEAARKRSIPATGSGFGDASGMLEASPGREQTFDAKGAVMKSNNEQQFCKSIYVQQSGKSIYEQLGGTYSKVGRNRAAGIRFCLIPAVFR